MSDSHAHLSLEPISNNVKQHLDIFKQNGGKHILNVSFTPETIEEVIKQHLDYEKVYSNLVLTSVGVHPEYFSDLSEDILKLYLDSRKVGEILEEKIGKYSHLISAIGETGLDYHHLEMIEGLSSNKRNELIEIQKNSFRKHIEIAIESNLPLSIHTRDTKESTQCTEDALEIVSSVGNGQLRGSFHSYTGDPRFIEDILKIGFHIGFNGIVSYPSAQNVRDTIKQVPDNRILLETDCPLLPPQSVRSNRKAEIRYGTPNDIREIAKYIAQEKDQSEEEVLEYTTDNFQNLFLRN